jgi:hypothetical protein
VARLGSIPPLLLGCLIFLQSCSHDLIIIFLLLVMAIIGDGAPSFSWSSSAMASPFSFRPSVGGDLEPLDVQVLSHQRRHPSGFLSLSESNGKERTLMVLLVIEMNGGGWLKI